MRYRNKLTGWSAIIFIAFGLLIVLTGTGVLPPWTSILLVVVFVVAVGVRAIRGFARVTRSGFVFSDRVWQWQEGEALTFAEIWPGSAGFLGSVDTSSLPVIVPKTVFTGHSDSVQYSAVRLSFELPGSAPDVVRIPSALQLRLTFAAAFPGRVVVYRTDGPSLGRDERLESIQFNKETFVWASETKAAYAIFSPDFMEWYLAQEAKPILVFDGASCYCTVVETIPWTAQQLEALAAGLLQHIRHSGALGGGPR